MAGLTISSRKLRRIASRIAILAMVMNALMPLAQVLASSQAPDQVASLFMTICTADGVKTLPGSGESGNEPEPLVNSCGFCVVASCAGVEMPTQALPIHIAEPLPHPPAEADIRRLSQDYRVLARAPPAIS